MSFPLFNDCQLCGQEANSLMILDERCLCSLALFEFRLQLSGSLFYALFQLQGELLQGRLGLFPNEDLPQ